MLLLCSDIIKSVASNTLITLTECSQNPMKPLLLVNTKRNLPNMITLSIAKAEFFNLFQYSEPLEQ